MIVRLFDPNTSWYLVEYDQEIMEAFGFATGRDKWVFVSIPEMDIEMDIEMDMSFQKKRLSECLKDE